MLLLEIYPMSTLRKQRYETYLHIRMVRVMFTIVKIHINNKKVKSWYTRNAKLIHLLKL